MVDQALAHVRDRLEPAVRVRREAGHDLAVVHPPPVDALEVLADLPAGERRRRAELGVAGRIAVEVVDAEQERVDGRPLEPERHGLEHDVRHRARLRTSGDHVMPAAVRSRRYASLDVDDPG